MKKLLALILVCLFVLPLVVSGKKRAFENLSYPELNPLQLPEIQRAQTSNGIKLRLIPENKLPLVDMGIIVRGGSVFDPADKVGLASITAELLRIGGTADMTSEEIDRALDSRGISISTSAQNDFFEINVSCLKEELPRAMEILAKVLAAPAFDKDKFEEVRAKLRSIIARRNDDPLSISSREFNTLIYGKDSPFGSIQEYDHLENITIQDVQSCYSKFFSPNGMLWGVIGPVALTDIQAAVEKNLSQWQNKAALPQYPEVVEKKYGFRLAYAEKAGLNQSYIELGHLGEKYNAEEYAKLMIFNQIFVLGMDSRLFNRVRTKMGLTYGVWGGINTQYLYPGVTSFGTFTKTESTLDAINAIFDEMRIIQNAPVTAQELSAAKDFYLNSFVFRFSSSQKILNTELVREFYDLDKDYLKKLRENIAKVTAPDIQNVAKQYLHPDKMVIFVLGPEGIADKVAALGKTERIDISIKPVTVKEEIPNPTPESLKKGKDLFTKIFQKNYRGLAKVTTTVEDAVTTIVMPQGSFAIPIKSSTQYPDKAWQELTMPFGKMEIVINGNKGIQRAMGKEEALPEAEIVRGRVSDPYTVFHALDKNQFQYLQETEIQGKRYDVVYMTDNQKHWVKFYVNHQTGLIEIEDKIENFMGQEGMYRVILSDFRAIQGITFPFKSEMFDKGKKVLETVVKAVQVNVALDPALFDLTKKK